MFPFPHYFGLDFSAALPWMLMGFVAGFLLNHIWSWLHGRRVAARAAALGANRPAAVISSGETTVTVRGRGRGGRNQEFATALVERLATTPRATLASLGTDGIDGPTDAAGAIVDAGTRDRAVRAGVAPGRALEANDCLPFLEATGDLVRLGPTGTNVGDLQVLLVDPA